MEKKYKLNTLRHWYLGEYEWRGEKVLLAYGQFYNRPGFYDGMNGHTSIVQTVKINHEEKEFEIQTMNNLYHCSFDSCFFERQDDSPYKLPEYEAIKTEMKVALSFILLILAEKISGLKIVEIQLCQFMVAVQK